MDDCDVCFKVFFCLWKAGKWAWSEQRVITATRRSSACNMDRKAVVLVLLWIISVTCRQAPLGLRVYV